VLVAWGATSTWWAQAARRERDRAVEAEAKAAAAEARAIAERDRALSAEQQATIARDQARQDRDVAIAEQGHANTEAARARAQRLISIWQSLARESARDLASREDDDRAALLARQAFLFHARTPDQPQYIVEDALQKALRLEQWGHPLTGDPSDSVAYSPDGSHLAAGYSNGGLELWDAGHLDAPPVVLLAARRAVTGWWAAGRECLGRVAMGFNEARRCACEIVAGKIHPQSSCVFTGWNAFGGQWQWFQLTGIGSAESQQFAAAAR